MSEKVKAEAEQTVAMVDEVNAVVLPEPGEARAVMSLEEASPEVGEEIRSRMDEIDMSDSNSIVAFGAGAHQCLGLHLARLEMRILFEVLLDRIETVELAGEPARSKSTFVGGLKTLPLRFTAA